MTSPASKFTIKAYNKQRKSIRIKLKRLLTLNECKYMKHIFELRMKDQIEERSSQLLRNLSSCEKDSLKKIRLERDSNP